MDLTYLRWRFVKPMSADVKSRTISISYAAESVNRIEFRWWSANFLLRFTKQEKQTWLLRRMLVPVELVDLHYWLVIDPAKFKHPKSLSNAEPQWNTYKKWKNTVILWQYHEALQWWACSLSSTEHTPKILSRRCIALILDFTRLTKTGSMWKKWSVPMRLSVDLQSYSVT